MRFPLAIVVIGLLAVPRAPAQDAPAPNPYLSVLPNYEETYQYDKEFDAYEFTTENLCG